MIDLNVGDVMCGVFYDKGKFYRADYKIESAHHMVENIKYQLRCDTSTYFSDDVKVTEHIPVHDDMYAFDFIVVSDTYEAAIKGYIEHIEESNSSMWDILGCIDTMTECGTVALLKAELNNV